MAFIKCVRKRSRPVKPSTRETSNFRYFYHVFTDLKRFSLPRQDAKQRLSEYGANTLKQKHKSSESMLLASNLLQNWYQPFFVP
jgi:hypothetical protein